MIVTDIKLFTPGVEDEHVNFNLENPSRSDRYILKAASGLDSNDIIPVVDGSAGDPSNVLYNMVLNSREVVFLLELNAKYTEAPITISELRDLLYKIIFYNRQAKLQLRFDNNGVEVASLYGFISKIETDLFTSKSELKLTFTCPDPFFKSSEAIVVTEFEYAVPPIEGQSVITYWDDLISTAPHGYQLDLLINEAASGLVIYSATGSGSFSIDYEFEEDDVLYLSSEYNNRYLYIIRDAVTTHIAEAIESGSTWPMMFPGQNSIVCSVEQTAVDEIRHQSYFWGI